MGDVHCLVASALLLSLVTCGTAEQKPQGNPLVAIEHAVENVQGLFTTTAKSISTTSTTVTPFDSSGSSGSKPNFLVSSNLGGAWQARSSDADPSGSMQSWGFKASGSSGWYQEVWQWIVIDGLFGVLCCSCFIAAVSFISGCGRKKKRSTHRKRKDGRDLKGEDASQMAERTQVGTQAGEFPRVNPLLPERQPLVATSSVNPWYSQQPATTSYAAPALAARYVTLSLASATRLATAGNVYAAPQFSPMPSFAVAGGPYAVPAPSQMSSFDVPRRAYAVAAAPAQVV